MFKSMSIQYKLLLLLVTLPSFCISLYLLLVMSLFEKDKIAYVFDSSMSVSKSLSTQVRAEINFFRNELAPIVEGFNANKKEFDSIAKKVFENKERLQAVVVFKSVGGVPPAQVAEMVKGEKDEFRVYLDNKAMAKYVGATINSNVSLNQASNEKMLVWFGLSFKDDIAKEITVVLGLFTSEDLIGVFKSVSLYASYLIDEKGQVIFAPDSDESDLRELNLSSWDFYARVVKQNLPEGTVETLSPAQNRWFVSYADVKLGKLKVMSFVGRKKALRAMDILLTKSLLFFVGLISFSVLISFFSSRSLTKTLRVLSEATERVSQGEYDIQVETKSKDEVGQLSESFNNMARKITQLMADTAEKARMENELKTAQLVQETLFPKARANFGGVQISGFFAPASECGGDWWFYQEVGDYVYLLIGDATGHGAPAALITSAAKSAFIVITMLPDVTPALLLDRINKAICETSKGKVCMTVFVAAIEKKSGMMTYSIAGHDPPFYIGKNEEISKSDLLPLNEPNGKRCGDDINSQYHQGEQQLVPGDTIVFYTDGVVDVENIEGKKWAERKFIKSIVGALNGHEELNEVTQGIVADVMAFKGDAAMVDDITFFLCRYNGTDAPSDSVSVVQAEEQADELPPVRPKEMPPYPVGEEEGEDG